MMITKILQRVFLLVFIVVPLGVAADDDEYSALIVFGDSLSDTGNLAAQQGFGLLLLPPFDNGRLTNGPVAVERLAKGLKLPLVAAVKGGTNFAVAGATARQTSLASLPNQVNLFLSFGFVPSDALYLIFIGGNDIFDILDPSVLENPDDIIDSAVLAITNSIELLAMAGAENFFVANAADAALVPAVGGVPVATALTVAFNEKLGNAIDDLEDQLDIDVVEFDTFGFVRSVIAKAERKGSINTVDACFSRTDYFSALSLPPFPTLDEALRAAAHPDCLINPDPSSGPAELDFKRFVFFDEIHPAAWVHKRAGKAMLKAVKDNDDDDDDDGDNDDD